MNTYVVNSEKSNDQIQRKEKQRKYKIKNTEIQTKALSRAQNAQIQICRKRIRMLFEVPSHSLSVSGDGNLLD